MMITTSIGNDEPCDECRGEPWGVVMFITRSGLRIYLCERCLNAAITQLVDESYCA